LALDTFSQPAELPSAEVEGERLIAWLRLAAVPIIFAAETLPHPNPDARAFDIAIAVVAVYAVTLLVWVHVRPVGRRFALLATAADVGAITVLAVLSGGAYSEARLAYFLIPITVAFRFRPGLTGLAAAATVAAYLAQALAHPASKLAHADRFIAVQASYLAWLGVAALLLSAVLERRTRRVVELAEGRRRLIAEALTAEDRERRSLAEGLHDHAIQNLLSARHDLEEVAEWSPHPALSRADDALAETIDALREAVFELHPYVLEQAGLQAALRTVAKRSSRHGGFALRFELGNGRPYGTPYPHESLLLTAARELLANVAHHAGAENVMVKLVREDRTVVLEIVDDGSGFDPRELPLRLAEGHIGLQSQRERIESVGGQLEIRSGLGQGTSVRVHVPDLGDSR
jgi:two-component system NarL family sensor kinase